MEVFGTENPTEFIPKNRVFFKKIGLIPGLCCVVKSERNDMNTTSDSFNFTILYDHGVNFLLSLSRGNYTWPLEYIYFWLSPSLLYTRLLNTLAEALEHLIYACLVYLLVCLGIYRLVCLAASAANNNESGGLRRGFWRLLDFIRNVRLPEGPKKMNRALFVVAHPDDECMFFGPLIYCLTQRGDCQVYILCLSNGNYEQQSNMRREELWLSCKQLGIPASNVILVNATQLPDDPNVEWKNEAVANIILHTVESLDIQALMTFDRDGVSQHPNHCAVYYAAASLCLANLLPKDCKFYTLDSINIIRKYISILDLVCTCLMSTYWCILSWKEAAIIRGAMRSHKSQMKWFRWLYIYFSRYMFINSLREVNLADVELEMQIHDN